MGYTCKNIPLIKIQNILACGTFINKVFKKWLKSIFENFVIDILKLTAKVFCQGQYFQHNRIL